MRLDDIKFWWSPHVPYMIYHVTSQCNLNCLHCFNHQQQQKKANDLHLEEVARLSARMGPLKYLTLAGGEPLLRKDLAEIVKLFYRNNQLHIANIVTNGWLTDNAIETVQTLLPACPDLFLSVGVSVDGPESLHDELRQRPGSYQRAMATITALKKLAGKKKWANRLMVGGCGTYHRQNAEYLLPLAKYFATQYKLPYYIGLIRGDVPDARLKKIDIDHFRYIDTRINLLARKNLPVYYPFRGLRLALDNVVRDIIYNSQKHQRRTVKCLAGKKGLVLRADGDLLLCELLNLNLGNVRDFSYNPAAILNRAASRQAIRQIDKKKCHCSWECFQRMNVVFSPRMYPRLLAEMLKNQKAANK